MIISCIDGGLICGPILAILYIAGMFGVGAGAGVWIKRKFKLCKKSCKCDCHDKIKDSTDSSDPVLDAMRKRVSDRIKEIKDQRKSIG